MVSLMIMSNHSLAGALIYVGNEDERSGECRKTQRLLQRNSQKHCNSVSNHLTYKTEIHMKEGNSEHILVSRIMLCATNRVCLLADLSKIAI